MYRKILCVFMTVALCTVWFAGCGQVAEPDEIRPWAATDPEETTEPPIETTRQAEMSTMATLDLQEASITLPRGIYADDIARLEIVLWRAFFYRDQDFAEAAMADVLPYIADSAVPWGLRYIYDTFDPSHTHGEYEQLSFEDAPDPQALFPDMYYRVEESVIDFLARDVFGVEPDTATQTDSAYYDDGYWYFNCLATGMAGNETHIRACQILDEGHYRLTAELLLAENETDMAHEASAFVEIRPAANEADNADAPRVWQILRIETFE